jgi:hypothetical protein
MIVVAQGADTTRTITRECARLPPGRSIPRGEGPEGLAGRVESLFDVIKDPKTGETYSNSKIARMSLGDLTEEDVEGLRSGSVSDPPLSHLLAMATAFGVEPSYLVDGTGEALLGGEIARALGDNEVREIALGCARLPRREKGIVLGIVRQFEAMGANETAPNR